MKLVIFVRHGESVGNATNTLSSDVKSSSLTETGIAQAQRAADKLSHLPRMDRLFASPVQRAWQTGEIISKQVALEEVRDDLLWERGLGELNNKHFESAREVNEAILGEIRSGYAHGLESWDALKSRMWKFTTGVPEGITIAVSHRDPIASVLAELDPQYDDDLISGEQLKIPPASFTLIDVGSRSIIAIGRDSLSEQDFDIVPSQ